MNQPLYDALISAGVSHELARAAAEKVATKQAYAELIAEIEKLLTEMQERLNQRKRHLGLDDDEGLTGVRNRP